MNFYLNEKKCDAAHQKGVLQLWAFLDIDENIQKIIKKLYKFLILFQL